MQHERLSDFSGKGFYLLFSFPLYTKIKIDTNVDTTEDTEILDYNEDDIPNILHHIHLLENKDVRYLKTLVQEEKNFFHYCPFCKRELPITYKGCELDNEPSDSTLTTYSHMFGMSEDFEEYHEYAINDSAKRYEGLIEKIFDENRVLQMNLECTSKDKHKFYVIFQLTDDNYLMKTGQYPSILDFDNSLKEYRKVLKDMDVTKELTNAEILKTHNMGVGAFLYLRRIFEKLIFEKFEQAKLENNVDEHKFNEADTKDKVKILHEKGYVPNYLAEINSFVYDILSKGVHELSEKECKLHYDTLRKAILLILEEKMKMEQSEKSKKETKNELNKIHTKM
ncbi:hypothetical protein J2S78_002036 [Salibacterium salarium]|uniref:hypothetical protein n=1 Tax=Salibacterium salarium TaxID=284579 RepID=UPI00278A48DC|nr:hypothetical protein [Salibacterium salarium]MDQ0299616.1 hypothetical protein [Salibacterium salarium]